MASYVQYRLKAETDAKRGRAAEIAKLTGFSSAHVANAKNYGTVGADFAEAMGVLWGLNILELRVAAEKWASENESLVRSADEAPGEVDATTRTVEYDDRYPSRPPALAWLRAQGEPSWLIEEVASIRGDFPVDPGDYFWKHIAPAQVRAARAEQERRVAGQASRAELAADKSLLDDLAGPAPIGTKPKRPPKGGGKGKR